jgi:hypothetical protein
MCSILKNFPNTRITGCFFHFSQILWRKIQKDGMCKAYKTNIKFNNYLKMIVAIVFVQSEKMEQEKEKLVDYFLNTNADEYLIIFYSGLIIIMLQRKNTYLNVLMVMFIMLGVFMIMLLIYFQKLQIVSKAGIDL